ncbi:hypothetical protein KIH87_04035 [Paraneptunicella aestuarii]|uniref:hypothetical protein n=1 Tax=Paraneptunicella aestuarii TaxID=2831148 RepID=UPI001E55C214|nr:hypothetical protein [Paraneptunicella aestuarii]UAA39536.1 hypothetical protein KIH87_04035 [Paraneptunicella aestuarii]
MDIITDSIAGFFRFVFNVLIAETIATIFYFIGKWSLQLFTLGNYPNKKQAQDHEYRITAFGLAEVILLVWLLAIML